MFIKCFVKSDNLVPNINDNKFTYLQSSEVVKIRIFKMKFSTLMSFNAFIPLIAKQLPSAWGFSFQIGCSLVIFLQYLPLVDLGRPLHDL